MKIKETIERECCDYQRDLLPFMTRDNKKLYVCKYCGTTWVNARAPGEMDYGMTRCWVTGWDIR